MPQLKHRVTGSQIECDDSLVRALGDEWEAVSDAGDKPERRRKSHRKDPDD